MNTSHFGQDVDTLMRRGGRLAMTAVVSGLLVSAGARSVGAADALLVVSFTGNGQSICDTGTANCLSVDQRDFVLCKPTAYGVDGEITGCDWELFLQGTDSSDLDQIDQQLRTLDIAPNGNLLIVTAANDTVQGGILLKSRDISVFNPIDLLRPFVGGGPYLTGPGEGTFKKYLDGELSQDDDVGTKPWDALAALPDGSCEDAISASTTTTHTCPIIGSLSGGNTDPTKFGGIKFANEDVIRCRPTGFAGNGVVANCDYSVLLDASRITIGGLANGIGSDIEAIDFLDFDADTMLGEMVFMKKSGSPPNFPTHTPGKDLLVYTGRFGSGLCVPSGEPCAADSDCPGGETCSTGTCDVSLTECSTDQDCSGAGNDCVFEDATAYEATVTKFFDGVAVGLSGTGQTLEAFALLPDGDGDTIPSGLDNCPDVANPPNVCDGPGSEACPGGDNSECPSGESCVQVDTDGDGVGDVCDQCEGRPDPGTCVACPASPCPAICNDDPSADCDCGDGVVDPPSETCDLGSQNGVSGSGCPANCRVPGKCLFDGSTVCTFASECPDMEACCGNGLPETGEACDDGNVIENDGCLASCTASAGSNIIGCDDLFGPNIIPAALKLTKFKDTPDLPDFDRWKTKGEFPFPSGLTIDPDTQPVRIVYNVGSTVLFDSQLDPTDCSPTPCFLQSGTPTKPKWKFVHKPADLAGAPSWRKGKLRESLGISNKGKFTLDGRNATLFTTAEITSGSPRQTIRIGDVCITNLLACTPNGSGKTLKCLAAP